MNEEFRKLWMASGISNLGDGVMSVAFPLLVASITRDPFLVAVATVINRLPWLLFALVSGALVDRLDRRLVMVVTDVARGALVGTLGVLLVVGDVGLPIIYVIAFALGTAETFFDTSAEAILPTLVGSDGLEKANGKLQATEWLSNAFAGPPLGALLFVAAAGVPFIFDGVSFIVAAALVASIAGTFSAERAERQTLRADIKDGLSWLWGHTVLRTLSLMAGITNLVGFGIFAIFVLFMQDIVGLSDVGYGLVLASVGVGGLAGALAASRIIDRLGPGTSLTSSVALLSVLTLAMSVSSNAVVIAVIAALYGLAITMWNVVAVSLRQRLTPDHMRGRVAGVARLLAWGSQPVGALLGGVAAGAWGLRAPFFIAAGAWAVLAVAVLPIVNNRRIAELMASAASAGDGENP